MGIKCHTNSPVTCDSYLKYDEAEVYRSPIMQDFRDNEKKRLKWSPVGHVGFYYCKICHGLSLCETLRFILSSFPAILFCFLVT